MSINKNLKKYAEEMSYSYREVNNCKNDDELLLVIIKMLYFHNGKLLNVYRNLVIDNHQEIFKKEYDEVYNFQVSLEKDLYILKSKIREEIEKREFKQKRKERPVRDSLSESCPF